MLKRILEPATTISSKELIDTFKCSTQGGMRRSLVTGTLIVVSKQYDNLYEDRWVKSQLHYTGMGLTGDQDLRKSQNKTLANHKALGVSVHLFEQFKDAEYFYQGEVELSVAPYQERQKDINGTNRIVWMFPLSLISGRPAAVPADVVQERDQKREKKLRRMSDAELAEKAKMGSQKRGVRRTEREEFDRNPYVVEITVRRANGLCELCEKPAPFTKKNGAPCLECHHIIWLARGGPDTIDNTAGLCPNCHRKMHSLNLLTDQRKLKSLRTNSAQTSRSGRASDARKTAQRAREG